MFLQDIVFKYKIQADYNRHRTGVMVRGLDLGAGEPESEPRPGLKKKKKNKAREGKRERQLDRNTTSSIVNGRSGNQEYYLFFFTPPYI